MGKSSIVFQREFSQLSKSILATRLDHNKTLLDGSNLLVYISIEIWYRYHQKSLVISGGGGQEGGNLGQ